MIIDASVAVKWLLMEPDSPAAVALVGREDLAAPTLLLMEVGNALWKKALRGEIRDHDNLGVQLANLADLVRTIDEHAFIPRAMDLAIALRHPIYDCIYLAIAEQNDDVLVTADARFLAAVRSTDHAGRVRPLVEPQP